MLGLLGAWAYPGLGEWAWLGWLYPAGLLAWAAAAPRGRVFARGWWVGFVFHLFSVNWLRHIPYPVMPWIGWVVLSAYLALYPGLWCWICLRVLHIGREGSLSMQADSGWSSRIWVFQAAIAWVALEYLVGHLLTGFAWLPLGVTQVEMLPMLQLASVGGVGMLSGLMVWTSLALLSTLSVIWRRRGHAWAGWSHLLPPILAVVTVLAWGTSRAFYRKRPQPELRILLMQPSIPQTVKWNEEGNRKAFLELVELTDTAAAMRPDLIVWPEAATPRSVRYDRQTFDTLSSLAASHSAWMVVGSDDYEWEGEDPSSVRYYNAVHLLTPKGRWGGVYRKRKLVIFGEYIPWVQYLPFLKWFTPVEGGFSRGKGPGWFTLSGAGYDNLQIGSLICFEDVPADLASSSVLADTDFLLVLTNDGWFGTGAAQRQHAAQSQLRAVENGVAVARCSNNGWSGWINAYGAIESVYRDPDGDIHGRGAHLVQISRDESSIRPPETLFHRHPQWFSQLCALVLMALLGWRIRGFRDLAGFAKPRVH